MGREGEEREKEERLEEAIEGKGEDGRGREEEESRQEWREGEGRQVSQMEC